MKYTDKFTNNSSVLFGLLLLMWGSYAAISKLVLYSIDVFQVQFYCYGISSLVMIAILVRKKSHRMIKELSLNQWFIVLLCGVLSCAYNFLYNIALSMAEEQEIATVVMINYLFPIFVTIFSVPINGERLNMRKVIAIFIGMIGAFVVISGGAGLNLSGGGIPIYGLALLAAISWGLFSGFGKKNDVPMDVSNTIYVLVGFVLSSILLLLYSSVVPLDMSVSFLLLWRSLSNFVLAVFIWFKLLNANSSSKVAGLSLLTPFVTLLFVKFVFSDTRIDLYHIVGLGLIMAGVLFQSDRKRKEC